MKIIKNIPLRRKYVIINISDIIDNSSVFNNIPERSNKNITVKYCTIFYQNLRGGGGGRGAAHEKHGLNIFLNQNKKIQSI